MPFQDTHQEVSFDKFAQLQYALTSIPTCLDCRITNQVIDFLDYQRTANVLLLYFQGFRNSFPSLYCTFPRILVNSLMWMSSKAYFARYASKS